MTRPGRKRGPKKAAKGKQPKAKAHGRGAGRGKGERQKAEGRRQKAEKPRDQTAEIERRAAKVRRTLAAISQALHPARAGASERERDAARKRATRAAAKDVAVPDCQDRARRQRLEADDEAWLLWYYAAESGCKNSFWYPFTEQQKQMIAANRQAQLDRADQFIAASRGEGKTTIFERMTIKDALSGVEPFTVLMSATRGTAEDSLDTIKDDLASNARLAADYPEICTPIAALENTPSRAHYMTASGTRHDTAQAFQQAPLCFKWCGQEIFLPATPGAPGGGAIIATRGLERSPVRGLKKRGRRPTKVGIDDPDTEETAADEKRAAKLVKRINRALAFLGGQQENVSRVMLSTLQTRVSASYQFSLAEKNPGWNPKVFRFLVEPPANRERWDEYVQLRQADLLDYALGKSDDRHCRRSHQFYLDDRAAMDAGARVANPHRYNGRVLPDGSQVEVSALERYFNEVARVGQEAVDSELDNNPPEETAPIESAISAHLIYHARLNGYLRRVVPPECIKLTRGVDVRKTALHWVVRAWRADGAGFTIDHGVHEVRGTRYGSDEGVDEAIRRAILEFLEESQDYAYHDSGGQIRHIDRTMIDAGYRTEAVYAACAQAGLGVTPIMGEGFSAGCSQRGRFKPAPRSTRDTKIGNGYKLLRRDRVWLAWADSDRWKRWEHDRWLAAPGKPGSMTLFGEAAAEGGKGFSVDEKLNFQYAKHVTNEIEVEEIVDGQVKRHFKVKSENQHWLDASYYSDVGAAMEGVPIIGSTSAVPQAEPEAPPSLEELAKRARG